MEEVEVTGMGSELALEPGNLIMPTRQLTQVPAAVEVDLFRAVQTLPGVSTLSDYSSGLHVRGGECESARMGFPLDTGSQAPHSLSSNLDNLV